MSLRIVLTGASRGLGRAMTDGFTKLGHTVIGCTRSREMAADLTKHYGKSHRFDVVDVSNQSQVAKWAKSVLADDGPPDLLINNAAVMGPTTNLWEAPVDEFGETIDINIKGVFYVLREFVPAMIERNKGVIVNFSSGWGRSTSPEVAAYCATKYAIEGLTQALAQELPEEMTAVPLNPGVINTDMLQACFGEEAKDYPSPEQWAVKAVPFILRISRKDNGRSLTVH
jgi:NAD(P)-dependent dehydrogenase (short-subunit alcohol dehydrogenase family)